MTSFVSQCLRGIEAGRLARGVDRREEADEDGRNDHEREIERQHGERQMRDLIDVGGNLDDL